MTDNKLATRPSSTKMDLLLDRLASNHSSTGRLCFALDATMSRQPTWDKACQLQAEMFAEAAGVGGLEIQLVYFRGSNECRASGWLTDAKRLGEVMSKIDCRAGETQIAKVLRHTRQAHDKTPISGLILIGDSSEEGIDTLCAGADELGARGIKAFVFQEGDDATAEKAFREIARLTHGAYCKFSPESARELGDLLRAVAAYAAGGLKALGNLGAQGKGEATRLLEQIR
jgi:hypothetical protein